MHAVVAPEALSDFVARYAATAQDLPVTLASA